MGLHTRLSGEAQGPWSSGIALTLAVLALATVPLLSAQSTDAPMDVVPIGRVAADRDTDFVPDRLGDTVTVAGHATVGTGTLDEGRLVVFLQDSTGGVQIYAEDVGGAIERGDRVVATGTVGQYRGQTRLRVLDYQIADEGDGRRPGRPRTALSEPDSADLEAHEGRVVHVSGLVLERGENDGGRYLSLYPDGGDGQIQVFAADWRGRSLDLSGFEPGDRVEVTGVLGQYDRSAPYTDGYQVYPRSREELGRPTLVLGLTAGQLRLAGTAGLGLLVLAFGWWGIRSRRQREDLASRHEILFDRNQAGVCRMTVEGEILDCNRALAEMYGFDSAEQLTGSRAWDIYSDYTDRARYLDQLREVGEVEDYVHEHRTRDGETLWVLENARLVETENGDEQIVGTVVDITDRVEAERQREAAEKRYRALFEQSVAGAFRTTPDGKVLEVNRAFAEMLGYDSPEQIEGRDARELYASPDRRDDLMGELSSRGTIENAEIALQTLDGGTVWVLENSFVAEDPETGEAVNIGTVTEITHHVEEERELEELAHRDPLTGIPNRRFLEDAAPQILAQAERSSESVGVVYLDLNDFKEINDRWGHDTGDAVLRTVARRLEETVRGADLVGRIGGDEFILILSGVEGKADVLTPTRRLVRQCFERPVEVGGESYQLSAKLGVAVCPADGKQFDELVKRADRAMYRASRHGEMIELYDEDLDRPYAGRLEQERTLREGLEDGRLLGHVQPIYALQSQTLAGVELLARWQREDGEVLGAGPLLRSARAANFLAAVDREMVRKGVEYADRWRGGTVSVNLSVAFLESDDAFEIIRDLLHDYPAAGEYLTVEVPEQTAFAEEPQSVLRRIEDLGLRLSLDDFGTGYSSLSVLEALEVDEVKIDRSLVRRLGDSGRAASLVEGVVDLAHSVGAVTVAEGIESADHLEWLAAAGCDRGQGYLLGRPTDPETTFPTTFRETRTGARSA